MNRTYKINLRKEEEGGYTVFVPSLPSCITYGETVDEAIDMAKEAIELYIEEFWNRQILNNTCKTKTKSDKSKNNTLT